MDVIKFAHRLQKAREATGKSQQKVADDLGINRNQIKVWECGTREIKAKDLFTLSKYYGVPVDYLLGLTECASNNTDLRSVCDYTRLSEKAVRQLRRLNGDARRLINKIINDVSDFEEVTL